MLSNIVAGALKLTQCKHATPPQKAAAEAKAETASAEALLNGNTNKKRAEKKYAKKDAKNVRVWNNNNDNNKSKAKAKQNINIFCFSSEICKFFCIVKNVAKWKLLEHGREKERYAKKSSKAKHSEKAWIKNLL